MRPVEYCANTLECHPNARPPARSDFGFQRTGTAFYVIPWDVRSNRILQYQPSTCLCFLLLTAVILIYGINLAVSKTENAARRQALRQSVVLTVASKRCFNLSSAVLPAQSMLLGKPSLEPDWPPSCQLGPGPAPLPQLWWTRWSAVWHVLFSFLRRAPRQRFW